MRSAAALPRDQLVGMGVTFGKFTKSKKFRLHVTCLDYIAQLAPYKAGGSPRRVASGSRPLRPWASRATARPPATYRAPAPPLPRGQVWVKPSAEQSFLYGNHVLKAGLGRITEDTPQNQGAPRGPPALAEARPRHVRDLHPQASWCSRWQTCRSALA